MAEAAVLREQRAVHRLSAQGDMVGLKSETITFIYKLKNIYNIESTGSVFYSGRYWLLFYTL
jgi:hypothetical protein